MLPTSNEPTFPIEPPRQSISRPVAVVIVVAALIVLTVWTLGTPPGVKGKADAVGYAICHRIELRSFLINAEPMPLCARCTGIYLGVMVSFLVTIAAGRAKASLLPPWPVIGTLVVFVAVMGIDGVNSYFHLFPGFTGIYEPNNLFRLVTGMFCGLAMFNLVFPVFSNLVWREPTKIKILTSVPELLGLCAVATVTILLVLSDRPVFLWVLGILSAIGVLVILTIIGTVLFLSVTRMLYTVERNRDLWLPLLAGFTLALIEIGVMDALRLWLTGTWKGFNIG
jgi:uncharacterized membrane protein